MKEDSDEKTARLEAELAALRERAATLAEEATILGDYFEQAPIGKAMTAPGGAILRVNRALCRILGRSREELTSGSWMDITHPDDVEDSRECIRALLAGERDVWEMEKRYTAGDGRTVWTHVTTRLYRDGAERPVHFMTHVQDVTDRKRTDGILRMRTSLLESALGSSLEEILRRALDEIESMTDSSIGFFHFVDPDQRALTLQAWSTRTMREFCRAEGAGLHYDVADAGVWVDCVRERRPVVHNDYASLPHRKGLPNGHALVVRELVVPVIRDGVIHAILGVGNKPAPYTDHDVETARQLADIAWSVVDRKRLADRLREQDGLYEDILRAQPAGAYRIRVRASARWDRESWRMGVDSHFAVEVASDRFCDLLGIDKAEFEANPGLVPDLVHPDDLREFTDKNVEAIRTSTPFRWEGRILRGGDVRWVRFESLPRAGEDGDVVWTGALSDITYHKALELERQDLLAALAQSDRLANMGLLAAGVAHEINNPLSYILYNLQSVSDDVARHIETNRSTGADGGCSESILASLRAALDGVERIREIATGLVSISRFDKSALEPIDVRAAVRIAADMARSEMKYQARYSEDIEAELPPVRASEGKLAQLILNMLINAAHAVDKARYERNEIRLRASSSGDFVRIEIADNGCGIREEDLPRIFEPFFTTKAAGKGTGLGLYICKNIVAELGGEMRVSSAPGEGTTFEILLPAADGEAGP